VGPWPGWSQGRVETVASGLVSRGMGHDESIGGRSAGSSGVDEGGQ
jgi:hypothetical protein